MARIRDQYTRVSIAYGAASAAALTVVLARHLGMGGSERLQLLSAPVAMAGAVAAALGLVAYGAALNDLLDQQRDAVVAGTPRSPVGPAVIVLVGALLLAMFASAGLGRDASYTALVLASLLLFHNAVSRFIPAIGLMVPGAVMAGIMLVPDWRMPVPEAVVLAASLIGGTSIAVHVLAQKRPSLSTRAIPVVCMVWLVMCGVVLSLRPLSGTADSDLQLSWWWPLLATILLIPAIRLTIRRLKNRVAQAERLIRIVALWQPVLAASWCLAVGAKTAAFGFVLVALLGGLLIGGWREVVVRSGKDLGWRS